MKTRLAPIVLGSALAASVFAFIAYDRAHAGSAGDQARVVADDVVIGTLSLPTGAALLTWDLRP